MFGFFFFSCVIYRTRVISKQTPNNALKNECSPSLRGNTLFLDW